VDFRGRSVVITGASSGIGEELALVLARAGAHLTLAARDAKALESVAAACEKAGGKAVFISADVADEEACRRIAEKAVAAHGGIDVLVNNAGISMWSRFDALENLSMIDRIMRVNYIGAVACTYYALPHLKRSKGLIVAISSLTGKTGVPTRSAYAASKHAMQGFFESLRIELRDSGVDVLIVSPGFVATPIRSRALAADGAPHGDSPRDESRGTMSVQECVRQVVAAMRARRRDLVMTPRARLALWVKLIAPGIVDRIAAKAVRERDS